MEKHKFLKYIFCLSVILLLSGCSIIYINKQSLDEIVDTILKEDTNLKTVSLEGYSYYLPQGVNLKSSRNLNSILYYNHDKMYLYVDLVSYYHKIDNTYEENKESYYSRKFDINDKSGYLEINKVEDEYFIELMYNYSKIEAYAKEDDIKSTVTVMAYILNSVDYKNSILDSIIGEGTLNYDEETFNIFKANGNDGSNFIDVAEQHDAGRKNIKDEDTLEIEENLE